MPEQVDDHLVSAHDARGNPTLVRCKGSPTESKLRLLSDGARQLKAHARPRLSLDAQRDCSAQL